MLIGRFSNSFLNFIHHPKNLNIEIDTIFSHKWLKRNKGTAILMVNMGAPEKPDQVKPFLKNLFMDEDLCQLPFQTAMSTLISTLRAPKVSKHYEKIGGSPLLKWTNTQGTLLTEQLNKCLRSHAPFKHFVALRYTPPFAQDSIDQIVQEGFKRLVVFSQYQQYSCCTSGSSFNELASILPNYPDLHTTFIDRWYSHSHYISSIKETIEDAIKKFDSKIEPSKIFILFSGHALPLMRVIKGDTYISQVATTVELVMKEMQYIHPYRLAYQSQVGPIRWFGANTKRMLDVVSSASSPYEGVVLVPITFTSDHIETLYELDIELMDELKKTPNRVPIVRAESLNDRASFITALNSIFTEHIMSRKFCSHEFHLRCHECTRDKCERTRQYIKSQEAKFSNSA